MFNKNIKVIFQINPEAEFSAKFIMPKGGDPSHLSLFLNQLFDGNEDFISGVLSSIEHWGKKHKWEDKAEDIIIDVVQGQQKQKGRNPLVSPSNVISNFKKNTLGNN